MIDDEFIAHESGETDKERNWFRWVAKVKKLLSLDSLDGDQETEGFSLDDAYECWEVGFTPEEYRDRAISNMILIQAHCLYFGPSAVPSAA
jgi:hypothetical protein